MFDRDALHGRDARPALIIPLSVVIHAAAVAAVLLQPQAWPWALGVVAANHLTICVGVLTPRSNLLGANLTRLPESAVRRREICLTFDDGPDPQVTPRVLDVLGRYGAKASFFCVGQKAAAYPQLVAEIARSGHSVENHSDAHSPLFAFYGRSRLRCDIGRAQRALTAGAGRAPVFFRAPAGFRGIFLDRVLTEQGLRYVSWTRRGFDGIGTDAAPVLRRLTHGLAAGDILLLHDKKSGGGDPSVTQVLPALLERIAALDLHAVSLPAALRDESAT